MMARNIKSIYAFHHNPVDPNIGAGVRTTNVLKIVGKLFDSQVTLYTMSDSYQERNLDSILEKQIPIPFPLTKIKAGYLCMFPFVVAKQLRSGFESLKDSSAVIFETPFMGYAVSKSIGLPKNSLKIYDAHNVEAYYWQPYLEGMLKSNLLRRVRKVEQHVADISDYIFVTSEEDGRIFEKEYSVDRQKLVLVPNGVDTNLLMPLSEAQKQIQREKLKLTCSKYVVFIGSQVKANIDAAQWIINYLAPRMDNVCFLIIGSVCNGLVTTQSNVKCLGVLTEDQKNLFLAMSDVAINPMTFGAGTNIKMLDYLSAGLPVITTSIGARGLSLISGKDAIISELVDFPANIKEIFGNDPLHIMLRENARIKAKQFDWESVSKRIREKLSSLL